MGGFYRRYAAVLLALVPFVVAALRDRRRFVVLGNPREPSRREHERRAEKLASTLLDLGPAFIKAGQVLSTRPDLVPPVYAETLRTLQDEVPEDVGGDPETVLRDAYGDGDGIDLDSLDPVAGGSLAFVYTADRTADGTRVALKVRRPDIARLVERDLRVIRRLIPLALAFAPPQHRYSLRNLADDFEEIIVEELDFEREARMMRAIGDNFADDDRVHIPWVDEELSTERVVVMEYVEGAKVTDHEAVRERGVDPEELADLIAETYLRMGLDHGVFHADPHPGNLSVTDEGKLAIYDYGMCEELTPATQSRIVDLYRAMATRDVDGLVDALIALDVLDRDVNRRAVADTLDITLETLRGREDVGWHAVFEEITGDLRDFPFRIPPDVMLLIRVGTVGEGVCRDLDPEFNFLDAARRYLVEAGHMEEGALSFAGDVSEDLRASVPALARLPRQLSTAVDRLERGEIAVRTDGVDRGKETGYAVLAASLILAGALLIDTSTAAGVAAMGAGALAGVAYVRS